jgi:hypothetical protein
MEGHVPFSECGATITSTTRINAKGRYIEPRISEVLQEPLIFFSREYQGRNNRGKLGKAGIY